jgi:hypothetical protein
MKKFAIVAIILLSILICINQREDYRYKVYGQPPFTQIPNNKYRAWEYPLYPAYRGKDSSFKFLGNPGPNQPDINWFGSCKCNNGNVYSNQCNQGVPVCQNGKCICGANNQYGCYKSAQTLCQS